jgi:hypothetical protein
MVEHLSLLKGNEWKPEHTKHYWEQANINAKIHLTQASPKQKLYEEWAYHLPYYFNKESRRAARHIPFAVDYHKALLDSFHSVCIFTDKEFLSQFHLPGIHSHVYSARTKEMFDATYDDWVKKCEVKYLMPNFQEDRDSRPTESERTRIQ